MIGISHIPYCYGYLVVMITKRYLNNSIVLNPKVCNRRLNSRCSWQQVDYELLTVSLRDLCTKY